MMFKKPFSLFLFLLVFHAAYAQSQSNALEEALKGYIQQEAYPQISQLLFDQEEIPAAKDYISLSEEIREGMNEIYKGLRGALSEEEQIKALDLLAVVHIQLGELYLERGAELPEQEKLAFFENYMDRMNLLAEGSGLSEAKSRSLVNFLQAALGVQMGMGPGKTIQYIESREEPVQEMLRAALILSDIALVLYSYEETEKDFKLFTQKYSESGYTGLLESGLRSLELFREGALVEDFTFVDLEGVSVRLSDFKDKIIYLDLWASWCGPCINTFRTKTPDFEKQLAGNDEVVLMYISIDEKPEAWKNYLSKNPMRGVHLFAGNGFQAEIMQYFKVWGIPRYLIIGKDNKLITPNAPRPGDEAYAALMEVAGD